MSTESNLKNINFMTQNKYDSIEPSDEELYAIEMSDYEKKLAQSIRDGVMPNWDTAVTIPTSNIAAPYNCYVELSITSPGSNGTFYLNDRSIPIGTGRDDAHHRWSTAYIPKGVKIRISGSFQRAVYYKLMGES